MYGKIMNEIVYKIIDDEVFVNLESLTLVLMEQPATKKLGLDIVLNKLRLRILRQVKRENKTDDRTTNQIRKG